MISPNEMKNKTFTISLRGYSKAEVDEYIATVANQYAELYSSYEALCKKNAENEAELVILRENEDAIRRALVNSQNAAAQVVENAKQRGEELEKLTREKCGQVIAEFRERIRAERERLNTLRCQVADFKSRIFEQYQAHIEMVESLTNGLDEGDWDMSPTDATRSVLALLRGDFERRTRNDEIEEEKLDREIDIVIDKLAKTPNPEEAE